MKSQKPRLAARDHFCENPLDVFNYYAPADSRYAEVEGDGKLDRDGDDSKVAATRLHIKAEIGLPGLIKAGVDFIKSKVDWDTAKETNTGYQSAATNTGDRSAATVDGKDSVAIVTGYDCKAKASLGSAIVVVERGDWNGETYPLLAIKAAIADGDTIKADTFYKLQNGEFIEVE